MPLQDKNGAAQSLQQIQHSPHLQFGTAFKLAQHYIATYASSHPNGTVLDVGGGRGSRFSQWSSPMKYEVLDIDPQDNEDFIVQGDICNCPQLPDATYDIVFSNNTFEHVHSPWKAAAESGRLLKPGGITVCLTVFAWRYHPTPQDYWRFTHTALQHIFESYGGLKTLAAGYDIEKRRDNLVGRLHSGLDFAPVDDLGGWRENWAVYYVGQKPIT